MMSCASQQRLLLVVGVVLCLAICSAGAKALPEEETQGYAAPPRHQLDPYGNHLVDDDGSLDAALINYLFAKQMVDRIKANADVTDLQRKRSYWKQCAFNAVSCFGKKK